MYPLATAVIEYGTANIFKQISFWNKNLTWNKQSILMKDLSIRTDDEQLVEKLEYLIIKVIKYEVNSYGLS